jgi:hypothetical protein
MAKKVAKSNKAKANEKAKTTKGANAKTAKTSQVDWDNLGDVYEANGVTAVIEGGKLLIECDLQARQSGSGKSTLLVSLGGIKSKGAEGLSQTFSENGGYFSVLLGYTAPKPKAD